MVTQAISEYMDRGGRIKVGRTRKALGVMPLAIAFGGNRYFLSTRMAASFKQGDMLRMGAGNRKYGSKG